MLKYWLIIILNSPIVVFGLLRTMRSYHKGVITRLRLVLGIIFWLIIETGLLLAQPIFEYLQKSGLTDSTPLSLFDVVQTTGVIFTLFFITRLYTKFDIQETRLNQLNREISIANLRNAGLSSSDENNTADKK